MNPQRLGDFKERINRDGTVRAFHLTDINGMEVSFFAEFFLAQTRLLPMQANVLADDFAVFRNGHDGRERSKKPPEQP